MFPQVSVLLCLLSCKSSFTFRLVHIPYGYTWEESENGVPGRSLQRYASWLRFHLDHRHRGRAFMQPLNSILLWGFPWKPHTADTTQNTWQNRGSHFILMVPHLGSISSCSCSWGSRQSCNERMRAVSRQWQVERLNSPPWDGITGGYQAAYACVHWIQKTTKYYILNSSLSHWNSMQKRHPSDKLNVTLGRLLGVYAPAQRNLVNSL